jgi:hypothetical protein
MDLTKEGLSMDIEVGQDAEADLRLAMEYESRLFDGGAYSGAYLLRQGRRTPKAAMIKRARTIYNHMRVGYGLRPVEDWMRPPECRLPEQIRRLS